MRHSIIFKFIAILLCAVSLLGVVGSALSIFILTEADLYNRTVDEMLEQQLQTDGRGYANGIAFHYASQALGGCSEEMVETYYGPYLFTGTYDTDYYGYALLDAEGNVLDSYNTEAAGLENAVQYTFPVEGKYLHLVSVVPESEKYPQEETEYGITDDEFRVFDAIPADGALISHITVSYDSGSEGFGSDQGIGSIFYDESGSVYFQSFGPCTMDAVDNYLITRISFADLDGNLVYEAADPTGVGELFYDDSGCLNFIAVSTSVPAIVGLTETTGVYEAVFYDENHNILFGVGGDPVGFIGYDENGYVVFRSSGSTNVELDSVAGVSFYDGSGALIYEAFNTLGVGTITCSESGELIFTSRSCFPEYAAVPDTAAEEEAETIPETTMEYTEEITEPETTSEETIDETTAETAADATEASAETTEESVPSSASAPEETAAPEVTEAAEATEEVTQPETTEVPAEPEPTVPETVPEETLPEETVPETTAPVLVNGKPLSEYNVDTVCYYDPERLEMMYADYVYLTMPEYTLELYMAPGAQRYEAGYTVLSMVRSLRGYLLPVLGICLMVFAIFAVYLCCSAGHKPKREEIRAGGLNCLPLDLYLGIDIFLISIAVILIMEGGYHLLQQEILVGCAFALGMAFLVCLVFVGYCFAFVAQIKTPGGYWWRNSLCGRFIALLIRFAVWLEKFLAEKFFPWLGRTAIALWKGLVKWVSLIYQFVKRTLGSFFRWIGNLIHRFFSLLPLTWQWLLAGFVLIFIPIVGVALEVQGVVVTVAIAVCIILYGAHCFGVLMESTKRMGKGNLDIKVDDKHLIGCFKEFAGDLNGLAGVAVVAAQKQLKSERMKTELITNVSHDIKTPLTSIINYVDLLQKPHTDEEQAVYLEVLDRQSQRLKKLIDDLMEMSKANTGNMAVDITQVDAVESITQALGEFADKLDKAQLTPVFRRPETSIAMMADGRLVWRVLSNLLSNAVKYALPGTRLYIDLMSLEGKVVISLKNISREELNVDAEELMERFVRGDDSRNTEGSGLGLNIAKSLMELQKGQLQLLVDGDLFKVTLIFPGA